MERRTIGKTNLAVSPLAFGGNVFGWTVDESTAFRLLDAFVDAGFNLIDTADAYSMWAPGNSGGESETIIGRWMKSRGNRDRVVIATKVGWELSPEKKGLAKTYILRAAEDSLRRLQTDCIDLYQAHLDDTETPLEETLGAFGELIDAGKVRVAGASNYSAERLAAALDISRRDNLPAYQCLQPRYNLIDRREFEGKLESLCVKERMGVICYPALASGFLSGKYRSKDDLGKSPRGARMGKWLNDRGFRVLDALDDIATRHESAVSQVALAWLLSRPSVTAPIVSATSLEQLEELLGAVDLKLDSTALDSLNAASAAD
jgi:aryl-alcohol dehydrogenase-like predicted oxidoreductase